MKLKNSARRSSTVHQITGNLKNILKLPSINKGKENRTDNNIFAQD